MRFLSCLMLIALFRANAAPPCIAPEPIEAFRRELRDGRRMGTSVNSAAEEERLAAIRSRLNKDPDNFYLWNMLLERVRRWPLQKELSAQLKAQSAREPASLDLLFLYGRSLMSLDTPEAIRVLEQVLQRDPEYAWVHKMFAYIYWGQSRFRDEAKLKDAVRAVFRLCPDNDEDIYWAVRGLDDAEIQSEAARRLRRLVVGRTDAGVFPLWSALWAAEFKTTPQGDHARLRELVRRDAEYIAGLRVQSEDRRLNALREAYKLAGDTGVLRDVQNRIDALPKPENVLDTLNAWHKAHPHPGPGTPKEEQQLYWRARLHILDELLAKPPKELFLEGERFWTLHMLEDTPVADLEKAAHEYLESENISVLWAKTFPAQARIAQAWVARGIHLDEVPRLLREALLIVENLSSDDMWDYERSRDFKARSTLDGRLNVFGIEVDLHLRNGDTTAAGAALRRMEEELEAGKSVLATMRNAYDMNRARFLEMAAEIAQADGRPLDALAFLQQGMREGTEYQIARLAPKARVIWRELGGTNEGWQIWSRKQEAPQKPSPAAASSWVESGKSLPDFGLKDLNGRTWTAGVFKGKTTLINIWATWCEPCRAELPYLAKLEDSLKGQTDMQILTMNVDDNPGLVEAFLKEKGYTFPVLFAQRYVDRLVPELSIPLTWIVDASGTLQLEQRGFSRDGERWMADVLESLKRIGGE